MGVQLLNYVRLSIVRISPANLLVHAMDCHSAGFRYELSDFF